MHLTEDVGHLTAGGIFLSSNDGFLSSKILSPLLSCMDNIFLFSFLSPNLSHERTSSLPLLKSPTVWCLNNPLVCSTGLQNDFDIFCTIGYLRFIVRFRSAHFIFSFFLFSSVPLRFSFVFHVQEVEYILYFVTGWVYASRHTILLGIGTAMSIWCQSKYYSLFSDIMSYGHNAAHNEACLYVYLMQ